MNASVVLQEGHRELGLSTGWVWTRTRPVSYPISRVWEPMFYTHTRLGRTRLPG